MVAHAYNTSMKEVEAGEKGVQGHHPQLRRKGRGGEKSSLQFSRESDYKNANIQKDSGFGRPYQGR